MNALVHAYSGGLLDGLHLQLGAISLRLAHIRDHTDGPPLPDLAGRRRMQ